MEASAVYDGLLIFVQQLDLLPTLLLAVILGMVLGAIPGIGGKIGIVLSIPFILSMDTVAGAVFLLAMHAVVHTGGAIPSILFGIPGSGPDAATVVDGHPLAQRGEAARALGAALAASGFGGVIGACVLVLALPLVKPLILSFGPPEIFMISVLGITFIASVSAQHLLKGLLMGSLGLLASFVGMDPISGTERYTFGQVYLWDGIALIAAALGLIAIPEILHLLPKQRIETSNALAQQNLLQGFYDLWQHRWLALRTSIIGALVGIIPGLGGSAASWLCYGHAVQSSKEPERFGKGAIEGVIGPEAANNSKEGGSLMPTLFFGIPGSAGMALMLGVLAMLNIHPGPEMMSSQAPLLWTMIIALVLANLLAVALFLLNLRWLAAIPRLPVSLLIPLALSLGLTGVYIGVGYWQILAIVWLFGCLGIVFKHYDWARAPFILGLILGSRAEVSLNQSLLIWGWEFLLRPMSLFFLALIVLSLGFHVFYRKPAKPQTEIADHWLTALLLLLFSAAFLSAQSYPSPAQALPQAVAVIGVLLCVMQLWRQRQIAWEMPAFGLIARQCLWLSTFIGSGLFFGFTLGLPIASSLLLYWKRRWTYLQILGFSLSLGLLLHFGFEQFLAQPLLKGWLWE